MNAQLALDLDCPSTTVEPPPESGVVALPERRFRFIIVNAVGYPLAFTEHFDTAQAYARRTTKAHEVIRVDGVRMSVKAKDSKQVEVDE